MATGANSSCRPKRIRFFLAGLGCTFLSACLPVPGTGSRISPLYIERTPTEYRLTSRSCSPVNLQKVSVNVYGTLTEVWSATIDKPNRKVRSLSILMDSAPGFTVTKEYTMKTDGLLEADVNESDSVVFPTSMPPGSVAYAGADDPVSLAAYLGLPDNQFDCPGP